MTPQDFLMQSLLVAALSLSLVFGVETQGSVSLPVYPQFNELKKITVGPDDQLDGSVDSRQTLLLFTHKANMISHLRVQNLATGEIRDLLPSDADSAQARFNEQGQIVFVYFKNNSRGDICYSDAINTIDELPLSASKIHCLPRSNSDMRTERSQPFWLGLQQIGFIETSEKAVNLVSAKLGASIESTNLLSGESLIAPSGTADGRFLLFNKSVKNKTELVLLERSTGNKIVVPTDIPGISGFSSFSERGDFVYFSHFMGDSNQDAVIDGHDNAVVWRVSVQSILDYAITQDTNKSALPLEQLTPMDLNCSFPVAKVDRLYLTCAFEGSLDIYSLPSEGMIPRSWSDKTIENAFESARSYQDRILLINALKNRTTDGENQRALRERLFNLHLLADELSAASYYADHLSSVQSLKIFLKARLLKKNQPSAARTFLFKEAIHDLEQDLLKVKDEEAIIGLVRAYLLVYQGKKVNLNPLTQALNAKSKPIQYWLYYGLVEELYPKDKTHLKEWLKVLKLMTYNKVVTIESRLYYSFELLQLLETLELNLRKQTLTEFSAGLKEESEVRALLEAETDILELILADGKKEKLLALQKIDKLMMQYKSQYFVRKAINIRAVMNFLNHQQFQQLSVVAANWLRDTPATSTEFFYARDVVISAAREQAYGYWGRSNARLASDYFFQSLSLTDDLESYAGYVNTMTEIGQRKNMEERLEYLQKHQVMKDGVHFVQALLSLQEGGDEKTLETAITDLQSIRADLLDPMRTLMIGYAYIEKFLQTKKGVEYDRELWQKAHQSLILTADLARGRRRIRAAALTNLGLLHLWGQNYTQSVRFWELRKQLGFDDPQMNNERQAFTWFYSQALFLSGQPQRAAEEIAELSSLQLTPEFTERKAFYLAMAYKFPEALTAYESVLKVKGVNFESLKEPGRSKVRLGMAYTYFKLKMFTEAKTLFERIISEENGRFESQEGVRTIAFEPHEIAALSWGFLGQMGSEQERLKALRERVKLVEKDLPALIQAKMQLAELLSKSEVGAGVELMRSALNDCRVFAADNGHVGQTVFRTLTNYMVHGILFEAHYKEQKQNELSSQISKTLGALNRQSGDLSFPVRREQWRLQYLWGLFQERVLGQSPGEHWRDELDKSTLAEELRRGDANEFEAIQKELMQLQ